MNSNSKLASCLSQNNYLWGTWKARKWVQSKCWGNKFSLESSIEHHKARKIVTFSLYCGCGSSPNKEDWFASFCHKILKIASIFQKFCYKFWNSLLGHSFKALEKLNEIKSPIWTFFVKQSFFSRDLFRFWSLGYLGVWRLIWRDQTCVKNLPWVDVEVCTKFASRVKEERRYKQSVLYIEGWVESLPKIRRCFMAFFHYREKRV